MPHDQLFKELLASFFDDFLHLVAPRLAPRLDGPERRILPTELFTDLPRGEQRRLDLVAEVPVRDGGESPAFVHVEIERDARPGMGERMWDYSRALALRGRRPILPIVLTLRGGSAGVGTHTLETSVLGASPSTFTYTTFGLSGAEADTYLASDRPLAWALAALMRRPDGWSPARHRLECLRPIARTSEPNEAQRFLLLNCVQTYLVLSPKDAEEYDMLLTDHANHPILDIEMTWAERMEAQGVEKGIARGRSQGMREIVLRQLERRFGLLPATVRKRVSRLRSDQRLQDLADRLLEARSLDDLDLD